MKYTQIASDAFEKLQLNAGILLSDFAPATGSFSETDLLGATGGGTTFEAVPNFKDFGDGIDNIPANTMELKKVDYYDVKLSGTFKTVDASLAKLLMVAGDIDTNKIVPRADLLTTDFSDVWWVGDYSDVNNDSTGTTAGFVAIHMMNTLSTGGFKLKSNDKDKADFDFEFTAHYSIENIETVPYEIYIKAGTSAASGATGTTGN